MAAAAEEPADTVSEYRCAATACRPCGSRPSCSTATPGPWPPPAAGGPQALATQPRAQLKIRPSTPIFSVARPRAPSGCFVERRHSPEGARERRKGSEETYEKGFALPRRRRFLHHAAHRQESAACSRLRQRA